MSVAYFESGLELTKQLQGAGIKVLKPAAFEPGNFKVTTLVEIKRSGSSLVILMSWYENDSLTVASSAQKETMTSTGWAWVSVPSRLPLVPVIQGWLYLRPLLPSDGSQVFTQMVSKFSKSHFNVTVVPASVDLAYSAALFDAIMLYAHAATKMMPEGGDLRNGEAMTAAVRRTTTGAGDALVVLDSKGDRVKSYMR